MRLFTRLMSLLLGGFALTLQAAPLPLTLAVWANEAIVAVYTYDYQHYMEQQKNIAHYFTAPGWVNYSTALNASKLPENVQKNQYYVSAVATSPPIVTPFSEGAWTVTMPTLVVYRNPQYEQKQWVTVSVVVRESKAGTGVRGLAIESFQAKDDKPACTCELPRS